MNESLDSKVWKKGIGAHRAEGFGQVIVNPGFLAAKIQDPIKLKYQVTKNIDLPKTGKKFIIQAGDNDDQLVLKEDKICVCVRKRPLNTKELAKKEHDAVTCLHPTATVHSAKLRVDGISKYCDHNTFRFDHAFDEEARTEDVYRYTAQPLVSYVCGSKKGFIPRATVFAYGQTGSGEFFFCVCVCLLLNFIL